MHMNTVSELKLGFIGLGKMGAPMARRLVGRGYHVVVYDVAAQAMQPLLQAGGHAGDSPKDVASRAEVVMTCLPSLEAVREVTLGSNGLCHGVAIKAFIDCSTTGPEFARTLARDLASHGIEMLDAPVSGGVKGARDGDLSVIVSGKQALLERLAPVFEPLGHTYYMGEASGQAQMMKLVNNLLSQVMMAATYEVFVLGVKAGLDPDAMVEVLNANTARNNTTLYRMPRAVLTRTFDYGSNMEITYKDSCLAMKEAQRLGVTMLIGNMANQLWGYGVNRGGAKRDSTTLITSLEEWAGVKVVGKAGRGRE
jgi:3-hydroxyisobutyrate dehydrogenase-like beta-hydroxyacid dehydrogenase